MGYCYYGPDEHHSGTDLYQATVAIYRPMNGRYTRLSNTTTISKRTPSNSIQPVDDTLLLGFNCDSYNLSTGINVQVGDVIGTCIFDPGSRNRKLLLVAESASDGYSMLYLNERDAGCSVDVLPNVVTNLEMDRRRKVLHVYAYISKSHILTINELHKCYTIYSLDLIISPSSMLCTYYILCYCILMYAFNCCAAVPYPIDIMAPATTISTATTQILATPSTVSMDISRMQSSTTMPRMSPIVTPLATSNDTTVTWDVATTTKRSATSSDTSSSVLSTEPVGERNVQYTLIAGVGCGMLGALVVVILMSVLVLVVWKRRKYSKSTGFAKRSLSLTPIGTSYCIVSLHAACMHIYLSAPYIYRECDLCCQ